MRFAVRVTQSIAQNDAAVFIRLHAEGELPWRAHHFCNGVENRREVFEIHEDIGGKHKVIVATDFRLAG